MSELKVVHDSSVDFQEKVASNPAYLMNKVYQQTNGTSVAVSATSTADAIFDLPAGKVFNFSKSFLGFNISIPALTANKFSAVRTNFPPIQRLALYTRSGVYLCDIPDLSAYWAMCSLADKTDGEFQCNPVAFTATTLADTVGVGGVCTFVVPSGPRATVANQACGAKISHAGAVVVPSSARHYITNNLFITSGDNAVQVLPCQLRFGDIPFCMLNMNKDFYCAENLQLLVQFAPYDKWALRSDAVDAFTNPASIGAGLAPSIQNLTLYIATEENASIKQAVIQKFSSQGLKYHIPYPRLDRNNLGANTTGSIISKINRGNGARLLRVLSAEALQTNTLTTSNNFYNVGAPKTTSYYTTLNSVRLQPEDLSITLGTASMYVKDKLNNTPLENVAEWLEDAPIHVDDFSACNSLTESKEKDYYICGLDLSIEQNYQKFINKSTDNTDELFAIITQKELTCTPMGVNCV